MESSNSDSESECFESAEESIEEDEKDDVNIKPNSCLQEHEIELSENLPHSDTVNPVQQGGEEISGNLLSYRKRPERAKRLHNKQLSKSTSKKPDEPIFKADKIVSEVFLQDITSNLSKNINRSLTTLQHTSSNVKELIFSTIPVSSHNNDNGFSYDDKLSVSTPENTVIDNKCYGLAGNVEDNFKKNEDSYETEMPTKEMKFSVIHGQSEKLEDKKLPSSETENLENKLNKVQKCNSEIPVLDGTAEKECNLEQQQMQDNPEGAHLNSDDINKGDETDNLTDKVESFLGFNEKSLRVDNSEILKQNDQLDFTIKENSFSEAIKCSHDGNLDDMNSNISQEITDEPKINENKLLEEKNSVKENFVSQSTVNNSSKVQENLTNFLINDEENGILETSAGDGVNNILKEKLETDSECNLKELKIALKNIIKEECDLGNADTSFKEDFGEEEIIFKEKIVDSETSKEGWDDFDFNDIEDENASSKQDSSDIKEESKLMDKEQEKIRKNMPLNINFKNESENIKCEDNLKEGNLKTSAKPSVQVNSNKSVLEDQLDKKKTLRKEDRMDITNEIIENKTAPEDAWDWDAWDDEDDKNEKVGEVRESKISKPEESNETVKNQLDSIKWSGWDNFGQKSEPEKPKNWSLGSWGMDILLNKATTVTQGISSAFEAGLGAPDPETLARMEKMERENMKEQIYVENESTKEPLEVSKRNSLSNVNLFPVSGITNLVAEVTSKIVEHSKIQEIGSKVISGGLDTLETFGKKTMEVLQEGDPGLKNKRALLLGDKKPVLSQVLKEAREKADREHKKVEERELAKKCHFETLFDDFQGMVHLEALEMLSRQYELKLEQLRSGMNSEEQEDFNAIIEEVEQLCSLDEYDMDLKSSSKLDFKIKLQMAVEPLKNEISTQKIIQIHEEVNNWLQKVEMRPSFNVINQKLVSTLAELTAATVQQFHKSGELLSVKECRKTVDEVDALLRLTNVLCAEINILSEKFISFSKEVGNNEVNNENMNLLSANVTTVMTNSTSYIRQAFNLLIPVLQFGAAVY